MRVHVLALAMVLSACTGQPPLTETATFPVVTDAGLPAPLSRDLISDARPYFIGPFDTLSISVFGIEELTRDEVQTDASGRISFPLVGTVEAAGKTPGELAETIAVMLRNRYVRDPQVSVNLKETVSQVVSVGGEVEKPGLYPVVGRMTLMRAIATAGGTAEFADLADVVVFRTVNGQRMAGLYNLKAIRGGMYDDPEIYASDVVSVGDSASRRLLKEIGQIAPLITSPLIILLR